MGADQSAELGLASALECSVSPQLMAPPKPQRKKKSSGRNFSPPPPFPLAHSSPTTDSLKPPQRLPIMAKAKATSDLTDDQIEQLLSAAEASLANNTVSVKNQQKGLAVVASAPAPVSKADDGKAGQKARHNAVKGGSEELAIRVPQLKDKKKKVGNFFVPPVLSFMMKANPKHA